MTDRRGSSATGGTAGADQPGSVRNVALVGHSGSGKTTLVEALLVSTGAIPRPGRVEDGTTVSDFDEVEVRQQRSVNLTLAPVVHAGIKVNLLDTPGYADFTGDLRAGLRAADAALFTVPATDGVDGLTRILWDECASVGMPRAVVITKLDHQRADFDEALQACRDAFGDSVAPLYLPVTSGPGAVAGLIGLLSGRFYDYTSGTRTERDPDPDQADRLEELRSSLIEGVIQESEDETLMDRYLSGESIDPKVLIEDLEKAVARGSFYPVLTTSALQGIGLAELLEIMTQAFPSPGEHPLPGRDHPGRQGGDRAVLRPGRAAAGRGGQDHVRSVCRPDQPGPGVLRDDAAGRAGARVRAWPGRARPCRPRHGRADRRAHLAAGQAAAPGAAVRGRGHLRRGQAVQRRDRRHAVGQGAPAAHGAVVDA